jgi:hypothetical protein
MPRLDPAFHRAPVPIARAQARVQQAQMLTEAERLGAAAGQFGQREQRFASVPIRLRIQKNAGPNTAPARAAALPTKTALRKRGFQPLPAVREG